MFSLAGLFILFAAVIGSASMAGILVYLFTRTRRMESPSLGDPAPAQLLRQMEEMREDLFAVQSEMAQLTERLDFTEKLLMSGADSEKGDAE